MTADTIVKVALPYAAAAALVGLVLWGKISPELAAMLATALALPSPLAHAVEALRPKVSVDAGVESPKADKQDSSADQE